MSDVTASEPFEPVKQSQQVEIEPLLSRSLSAFDDVVHGVTRRVRGLGRADGNISYTEPRDRDDAWKMRQLWCDAIGVPASSMTIPRQVHGADVFRAGREDRGAGARPGQHLVAQADGIITNCSHVTVVTTHADCLSLLLYDPVVKAVGAVHAGWRSTVSGVVPNTINKMVSDFGSEPGDIVAFVGPSICRECYEVGDDVTSAWAAFAGSAGQHAVSRSGTRFTFDLERSNAWLLMRSGLRESNIERSGICTKCNDAGWFSHRGQGPKTGRFASMIALQPE